MKNKSPLDCRQPSHTFGMHVKNWAEQKQKDWKGQKGQEKEARRTNKYDSIFRRC